MPDPTRPPGQLLPPLTAEEYELLKADIAEFGIRTPIDVDEDGNVLDGHHRARIAAELGIPCPTRIVEGLTADQKRDHALVVNLQRRQLSREDRRALIAAEITHDPHRSDRAIGRRLGVDGKTVGSVRRQLADEAHARAEEAQRRKDETVGYVFAKVSKVVEVSSAADERAWGAWVATHDQTLARQVMAAGWTLADAAAHVCRQTGCTDLDCQHAPTRAETAEVPQLPTPPLGQLGPYQVHPAVDLFPLVDGELFAEMVASIRQHGLLKPITVTHDRTVLVDGRIRWLACEAAGVEPTVTTLPADSTEEQILEFILTTNLCRTHWTPGQRGAAKVLAAVGGEE